MRWKLIGGIGAGVVVVAVAGVGALVAWGGPLADIRPDEISVVEAQPDREARGRALLKAAFEAHGGPDAWARHSGQRFTMRDEWPGWYAMMSPWPEGDIAVEVEQQRHSFDSVVRFADGSAWGIEAGETWTQAAGAERQWVQDSNIGFMLPTVHYFVELPQRMTEARLVRHVGSRTVGEHPYEVVYATWGSWAANDDFDQYMVYIEPDTMRIRKVEYTVREAMRGIRAVVHLDDFVEVDGVVLPRRYTVTDGIDADPDGDGFMHRMELRDLEVLP